MTSRTGTIHVDLNPFSSAIRPALAGGLGAVSAAHPLAVSSAQAMLMAGGSAADAAIAAQAVIAVVMPDAAGLGGDGFYLVRDPGSTITALNGAGRTGRNFSSADGGPGATVTVPGLVSAWGELSRQWGRLPLGDCLQPAIRLARTGIRVDRGLAGAAVAHRRRLVAGGAGRWSLLHKTEGAHWEQPELAATLDQIAKGGRAFFYGGAVAKQMATAIGRFGGSIDAVDLLAHRTVQGDPISLQWRGLTVHVPPPLSQGILLLMALTGLERLGSLTAELGDHAAVEMINSVFEYRHRVAEGEALLTRNHPISLSSASNRSGPRAYLHTAGVCCSDRDGLVISALHSVFDDFGSGVFVPEGGFVLNNRAGGFTSAPNDIAPDKAPVHTLAPMMVTGPDFCTGLATPGADGQVQTLLQVLSRCVNGDMDLATAIHQPRWRSEDGRLLVEAGHPWVGALRDRGHVIEAMPLGDMRAGSLMAAGHHDGVAFAVADWRRHGWSGVA